MLKENRTFQNVNGWVLVIINIFSPFDSKKNLSGGGWVIGEENYTKITNIIDIYRCQIYHL